MPGPGAEPQLLSMMENIQKALTIIIMVEHYFTVRWQDVLAEAQTETAIRNAQPDTVTVVMGTGKGTGFDEESAALNKVLASAKNER